MVPSTDSLRRGDRVTGCRIVQHCCSIITLYLFIVSAHFTDSVLKEPKMSIMPAKPKWIGFQPMIMSFVSSSERKIFREPDLESKCGSAQVGHI